MKKNTTWFMVSVIWSYELNGPMISDLKLVGPKDEEHHIHLDQLLILREEMLKRFDILVQDAEKLETKHLRLNPLI